MKYIFLSFSSLPKIYNNKIKMLLFGNFFPTLNSVKLLAKLTSAAKDTFPITFFKKFVEKLPQNLVANFQTKKRAIIFGSIILTAIFILGAFFGEQKMESFEKLGYNLASTDKYLALGQDYEKVGQFEDAEKSYLAAISLDPARQFAAYAALARIYNDEFPAKKEETAHLYLRGIAQNPTSRALMYGLAQYYESANKRDQALQWYQKIVAIYPQDTASRYKLIELQSIE